MCCIHEKIDRPCHSLVIEIILELLIKHTWHYEITMVGLHNVYFHLFCIYYKHVLHASVKNKLLKHVFHAQKKITLFVLVKEN